MSLIRRLRKLIRQEHGVSALVIAGSMFMIAGFTAIAIDASALFVERRADQTAADVGALAGGVELMVGVAGGG
ncbi:MAG: pilus assembly protein TadG-related protein, partial [Acidimicrobiia bacterium]